MRVSILIPCYNATQWIGQAIESALAQSWGEKEVIVVDDGSTDDSLKCIQSFGSLIRWETGPNQGGNRTRNRLLEMARGEWIQYLDADDYLLPDKIAHQMEIVLQNSGLDVVYGPVTKEFSSGGKVWRELQLIPEPRDLWTLLVLWYLPQTGAPLWRRQALVDVGGWKSDQPCCQEHELYLRLLMANRKFYYSDHGGAIYRQWGEHTVCKRDKPEVIRRRLEITERAEVFIKEQGELTPARHQAINQARFHMARLAWRINRSMATQILKSIRVSQPDFQPHGESTSRSYRLFLSLLGFQLTETLASWRRSATLGMHI